MVFQIQHRAREPQYACEHISNSSLKFLLPAIWPTEPQILSVDVTSFQMPSVWQKVKLNGCDNSMVIYKAIHLPGLLWACLLQILSHSHCCWAPQAWTPPGFPKQCQGVPWLRNGPQGMTFSKHTQWERHAARCLTRCGPHLGEAPVKAFFTGRKLRLQRQVIQAPHTEPEF